MSLSANEREFLKLEYSSLRKEIETSKDNLFKLIIGGAGVIPAAQSLASTYQIGEITLALPLIVVVLVLVFLTENHSMMRAGTYILENIEPKLGNGHGWETWLNADKGTGGKRTVDKLLILGFAILTASYFVVAVVLAIKYALSEFGDTGQYIAAGIYVVIGLTLANILYSHAKVDTEVSE